MILPAKLPTGPARKKSMVCCQLMIQVLLLSFNLWEICRKTYAKIQIVIQLQHIPEIYSG